jgi:pimeloyl-ACP methyl ester carboxylesterase
MTDKGSEQGPRVATIILACILATACSPDSAQSSGEPLPHSQSVPVEPQIQLEVLDWGGAGRPLVLLAGSGNTAHIFDEFAPHLAKQCCHVYGVTRRGYGKSSRPESGYDDQRLADDVLQVLDALNLEAPVLVGHSMAGGELTTLGQQHSDRLGGLVYLDALADPGDPTTKDSAFMVLYERLPAQMKSGSRPDFTSFSAYRARQLQDNRFAFPESELRQLFAEKPGGGMGPYQASTNAVHAAIGVGQKKREYSNIRVPVLAISAFSCSPTGQDKCIERPDDPPRYQATSNDERAIIRQFDSAEAVFFERWQRNVGHSQAPIRFVNIPRANHFIFLSHQADVVAEITDFVTRLVHGTRAG